MTTSKLRDLISRHQEIKNAHEEEWENATRMWELCGKIGRDQLTADLLANPDAKTFVSLLILQYLKAYTHRYMLSEGLRETLDGLHVRGSEE